MCKNFNLENCVMYRINLFMCGRIETRHSVSVITFQLADFENRLFAFRKNHCLCMKSDFMKSIPMISLSETVNIHPKLARHTSHITGH